MKSTTKYAALGVHQTTTLASVRVQSGRVIARATLPTEERAMVEFFRGMRGRVHVTFEEGGAGAVARAHALRQPLTRIVPRDTNPARSPATELASPPKQPRENRSTCSQIG